MQYLEFESLYKFVISVGIILILSPFVVFYLLFNKNVDLLIRKEEFDKLTQTSQEIINIKQKLFLDLINSNKCYMIAGFAIIIGLTLIAFGIYGWKKAQGQVDLKSVLENEKLKKEIGISSEEKRIKIEKEISNDKKILGNIKSSTVHEYMEIENKLFIRINKKFGNTHEIVQNVKIGAFEYDIIATSKYLLKKDYIFEIKYIKGNINTEWINKVLANIDKQTSNYSENTNRIPYRILIIVTENENYNMVNNKIKQIDKKNNFKSIVEQKSKIKYLKLD
ncbi:hypothetical protein [Clostridium sp. ATCC 25772]|uniref:hypothetical protein n=1 Tax=Clostridium sp. ATCC 25772 TaxID=1676991 RepID=UPI0007824CA0|nr:hypothetical protein [Clostridium sp. ATCC 25772]